MGVQIPPILVLIVCKTVLAGLLDENAKFTGYENLQCAIKHSMMVCRRNEIQLYDPSEGARLSPADDPAPHRRQDGARPGHTVDVGFELVFRESA